MHEHLKSEEDFLSPVLPVGLTTIREPIRVWKSDRLSEVDRLTIEHIRQSKPGITQREVDQLAADALARSARPIRSIPKLPEVVAVVASSDSPERPPMPPVTAGEASVPPSGQETPSPELIEATVQKVVARESSELRDILERMVGSVHPHATKKKRYEEVRPWIWAINRVLTNRGEVPPCVRPQATPGRFIKRDDLTESQKLMLNDRQIFDLEFAHRTRLGKPKRKWESLLRSEVFDPVRAASFVATVGSYDKKIDALGLREDEQLLMGAIRSEKLRKWWERSIADAEKLQDELRAAAKSGKGKVADENIKRWCEEFLALKVADGRPSQASKILREFYMRDKPANQLANRKRDLAKKGFRVG